MRVCGDQVGRNALLQNMPGAGHGQASHNTDKEKYEVGLDEIVNRREHEILRYEMVVGAFALESLDRAIVTRSVESSGEKSSIAILPCASMPEKPAVVSREKRESLRIGRSRMLLSV